MRIMSVKLKLLKPVKKQTRLAKKLQEKTHYVGFHMPIHLYKHLQNVSAEQRRSLSAEILVRLEDSAEPEGYERDISLAQ